MTLPTGVFDRVADAVFSEMDDRGLFQCVGEDLFDEIKEAVARAAIEAMQVPGNTIEGRSATCPRCFGFGKVAVTAEPLAALSRHNCDAATDGGAQ